MHESDFAISRQPLAARLSRKSLCCASDKFRIEQSRAYDRFYASIVYNPVLREKQGLLFYR